MGEPATSLGGEEGDILIQQPISLLPKHSPPLPLFLFDVRAHIRGNSCHHSKYGPCVYKQWINLIIPVAFYQENSGPGVENLV